MKCNCQRITTRSHGMPRRRHELVCPALVWSLHTQKWLTFDKQRFPFTDYIFQSHDFLIRVSDAWGEVVTSGGLAQGAGVRLHPGPPSPPNKGGPLGQQIQFCFFCFCFCFTVEKQENMLGPLCVANKNVASFNKSYTRHFISNNLH